MGLAFSQAVCDHADWRGAVLSWADEIKSTPFGSRELAARAFDVASALETVEPDRAFAVRMYLLAWRAAQVHPEALTRAKALAFELWDTTTVAEVCRIEYQHTRYPGLLLDEGLAWLDTGRPDKARSPLAAARELMPRDERVLMALRVAEADATSAMEVAEQLEHEAAAEETTPLMAESYACAARLHWLHGEDPTEVGRLLWMAFDAQPSEPRTFSLYERWCFENDARADMIAMYRQRSGTARDTEEAVDVMRRGGTRLALRKQHIGLAMQLLRTSLERAYSERLPRIPGHMASLLLLRHWSERAGAERELLRLIATGCASQCVVEERLGLLVTGLEIAWQGIPGDEPANSYATELYRVAPAHPALAAFVERESVAVPDANLHDVETVKHDVVTAKYAAPGSVGEPAAQEVRDSGEEDTPVEREPGEVADAESKNRGMTVLGLSPVGKFWQGPAQAESQALREPRPAADSLPGLEQAPVPADLQMTQRKPATSSIVPSAARDALNAVAADSLVPRAHDVPEGAARRAPRLPLPADVEVTLGSDQPVKCVTRDLSATGVFVVAAKEAEVGQQVDLEVVLPSLDEWQLDVYKFSGNVVRVEDGRGFGVSFDETPPEFAVAVERLLERR